jgi:putative DNA primase/helicase
MRLTAPVVVCPSVSRVLPIPAVLRSQERWLCWLGEQARKIPYTPRLYGRANVNDPSDWTDLETAQAALEYMGYDGLGFVLGGGTVGIDLDCCREVEAGALTPAAKAIVDRITSYTELSPSWTGVKIFLLADTDVNKRAPGVEIYSRSRYFTVAGQHVSGTPDDLQKRTKELATLCKDLFGSVPDSGSGQWLGLRPTYSQPGADDEVLLRRAHDAPNGAKFADLFAGRWKGRYPSQSEADLALCRLIGTKPNAALAAGSTLHYLKEDLELLSLLDGSWFTDDAVGLLTTADFVVPPRPPKKCGE